MAEHSAGPRTGAGARFKAAMDEYRTRQTYRDPQSQSALTYYRNLPAKSQKTKKIGELSNLERILLDDAKRPEATEPPRWELKKSLGEGGYGVVTMWERSMGLDQEPLRLAFKDTAQDPWFRDWCEEARLTEKLNDVGCVNVVKIIDWVVYSKKKSGILYEYLPHGTLHTFKKYYETHCRVTMPEAFIWHVFHSLATALCYHAHGTTAEEAIAGWEEIIHRDIKPMNILMADPDLNNRRLYPTIKLADYGLAYAVHNEDIRNLKSIAWSGGTAPYVAPEVMSSVRRDPDQAPHVKVYPESDVFSVGSIILEMMRMPFSRYHENSMKVIDFEFPFPYKFYPYSKSLENLAMHCVERDVQDRPLVREVYKRTKYYADLWYGKVSGPGLERPQEAYAGQVLWNKDLRNRFETNMHFRWNYTIHNDWFYNHTDTLAKLYKTATDPGKANVPRGDYMAIGNGIFEGGHDLLVSTSLHQDSVLEWPMRVFNREGSLLRRRDGKKIRRKTRRQLTAPILDENWKEKMNKALDLAIATLRENGVTTNTQKRELTDLVRQSVAIQHDSSARPTSHRLRDFKALSEHAEEYARHYAEELRPEISRMVKKFADEMVDYLSCKTVTRPRCNAGREVLLAWQSRG